MIKKYLYYKKREYRHDYSMVSRHVGDSYLKLKLDYQNMVKIRSASLLNINAARYSLKDYDKVIKTYDIYKQFNDVRGSKIALVTESP